MRIVFEIANVKVLLLLIVISFELFLIHLITVRNIKFEGYWFKLS